MTAQVHMVTGLPGNGKTLYTICEVKRLAEETGRQVYYHGIEVTDPEALPWTQLDDAKQWHTLPQGAIVVIDEAQRTFEKRPNGAKVPDFVAALETLRHSGIELWLITQHPMLIDSHARKLIGDHRHLVRAFGAKAARVHRWNAVQEQCDKVRESSEAGTFVYPARAYQWYKSAEIHTINRRMPKAFWVLVAVPILVLACAWGFYRYLVGRIERPPVLEKVPTSGLIPVSSAASMPSAKPLDWFEERRPRVPAFAHTAPVYDKITAPTIAPIPAACVDIRGLCTCYTQQGTRLAMPQPTCRQIVADGFFVPWEQSKSHEPGTGRASGPATGQVSLTDSRKG